MADLNLVFRRARYTGGPIDLVFGAEEGGGGEGSPVTATATIVMSMGVQMLAIYDNKNPRRVSTIAAAPFQQAARIVAQPTTGWAQPARNTAEPRMPWQTAKAAVAEPIKGWVTPGRILTQTSAPWGKGRHAETTRALVHQTALMFRSEALAPWGLGQARHTQVSMRFNLATPAHREVRTSMDAAQRLQALAAVRFGSGTPRAIDLHMPWQQARPVPPGISVVPVDTGTTTPRVIDLNLVFACPAYTGGPVNLVFGRVCTLPPVDPGDTIIVPIRSVYMTINNFSLFRVDTSDLVPATALSISLDMDSWTWNCSFALNGAHLALVKRDPGDPPIVLQTSINGTAIRFIVEKIGRERTFGSSQLRVQGRGIAAELDEPFAPILSFGNTEALTARQLLDQILTFNGESIGWDFGTTEFADWLVPAGVFSHTGTYISALNAVVGAVGGYVQPHNTNKQLDVLMRYPTPAWGWSTAIPDIVLPSAVTTQEGIDWVDKPDYNRVFVHGQEGGIVGRYTRFPTAGDMLAPAVTDPLITHADAARQRGRTIISDTGRIANVTLRLPVLAETGIIRPGRLIEYTDGPVSRIGMSRSVAIDVSMPTIYQTIMVETHGD